MNYLICDLNIQQKGHYIGYNQYILNNIEQLEIAQPDRKYSFLFNSEAKNYLNFPEYTDGRIHFLDDNCWDNFSVKDKITLFRKVIRFAKEHKTNHLFFMDLDQYQFPIFVSRFPSKLSLSGILFRPHHRIAYSSSNYSSKIANKIKRLKKILAEKFLTTKKGVQNIYILNDQEGVEYLNRFHNTTQFKYLPDPIFSYPSALQTLKKDGTFQFLIFGSMSERKNITTILKAYDITEFNKETELLVVGSADSNYLTYLNSLISNFSSINATKRIVLKAGFVSDEEMDNYFHQTDTCLLIYRDFYGSSGLLGRAALHKKKVIGANVGLLKELVEQNQLGITSDPKSIEDISNSLKKIIDIEIETKQFELFYLQYSPNTFLKTLFN
jgi:glycosyltransferase involved in cell wall biosynthesis